MRAEPAVPQAALLAIRAPFAAVDAAAVEPLPVAPLSLMLDLAGEALRPRLFVVQREGADESCLRPDFTAPVALAHLERGGAGAAAYRYEGLAFRAAAPGIDQPEAFLQLGLESYGEADAVAADVRMAALAWAASAAGGRGDLRITFGDPSLLAALVADLGLDAALGARLVSAAGRPTTLKRALDDALSGPGADDGGLGRRLAALPPGDAAALLEALWALTGVREVGGRSAAEVARRLAGRRADAERLSPAQAEAVAALLAVDDDAEAALAQLQALAAGPALAAAVDAWAARLQGLAAAGVPLAQARLSPGFGQTFSYYDGMMFEITSAALGGARPVASGGRYDGLLARLGGAPAPAVGCMVRPWRAFAGGEGSA